jgi:nucleoid-associated protein YgaU
MVATGGAGGAQRQNPTTTGIAGIQSHVVRDGDSLQSIAYAAYGDATAWRTIAEANGIDDPVRLRRGTELSLPRSPV